MMMLFLVRFGNAGDDDKAVVFSRVLVRKAGVVIGNPLGYAQGTPKRLFGRPAPEQAFRTGPLGKEPVLRILWWCPEFP